MMRRRKQVVAIVVAAGVAAAAAGGALAHGRPGHGHAGVGNAIRHHAAHGLFRTAADYLKLTPQALLEQLRAGKSLAEIAADRGKSVDGLKQAILAAVKTHLDKRIAAGRLSADQKQAILAKLGARLDVLLNRSWTGKNKSKK